jgi:RimJ/RimL family protein N-acetyltransferase
MSIEIQIKSGRLIIRPIQLQDSPEIFRYRSNPIANQYQGWIPSNIQDVQDFILNRVSSEINIGDSWFQYAIILQGTNELIGDIGLHFLRSNLSIVEIGITLDELQQGKGYATEALAEILKLIFHDLDKEMILAEIAPQNTKSIRLFSRLGFLELESMVKDLILRQDYPDDMIYSLSREDWKNRNIPTT